MAEFDAQKAFAEIESIMASNKALHTDLAQKDRLISELRADIDKLKEETKIAEPYMDILAMEDRERILLTIGDNRIFKQLKIRARQVYGPDGDKGNMFSKFLETILDDVLYANWLMTKARKFGKRDANT